MSNKILVVVQHFHGDKALAYRLLRTMVALEPTHSDVADVLISCRFDTTIDQALVKEVSRKFNVRTFVCRRQSVGWPAGCNDLAFGTLTHIWEQRTAKKMPDYKAVLMAEADCTPLCTDWIRALSAEWDRLAPKTVLGDLVPNPAPHVNGNALFNGSMEFLGWMRKKGGCSATQGWDYALAPEFKKMGWADTPLIRSWWQTKTITVDALRDLRSKGCVFLHGVKDGSGLAAVKKFRDDFI